MAFPPSLLRRGPRPADEAGGRQVLDLLAAGRAAEAYAAIDAARRDAPALLEGVRASLRRLDAAQRARALGRFRLSDLPWLLAPRS